MLRLGSFPRLLQIKTRFATVLVRAVQICVEVTDVQRFLLVFFCAAPERRLWDLGPVGRSVFAICFALRQLHCLINLIF